MEAIVMLNDCAGNDSRDKATEGGQRIVAGAGCLDIQAKGQGGSKQGANQCFHGFAFVEFTPSTIPLPLIFNRAVLF